MQERKLKLLVQEYEAEPYGEIAFRKIKQSRQRSCRRQN